MSIRSSFELFHFRMPNNRTRKSSRGSKRPAARTSPRNAAPTKQSARIADRAAQAAAQARSSQDATKKDQRPARKVVNSRGGPDKSAASDNGKSSRSNKENNSKVANTGAPTDKPGNPWNKQVTFGPGYQPPPGAATIPGFSPWAWPNPAAANFNPMFPWNFGFPPNSDNDKDGSGPSFQTPWQPPPGFSAPPGFAGPWSMPPFMWLTQMQGRNGAPLKRKAPPSATITKRSRSSPDQSQFSPESESESVDLTGDNSQNADKNIPDKNKGGRKSKNNENESDVSEEEEPGSETEETEQSEQDKIDAAMQERQLTSDAKRMVNTARKSMKTSGKSLNIDWMKPLFQPGAGLSPLGAHIKDLGVALGANFSDKPSIDSNASEAQIDGEGFAIADTIKAIRASSENHNFKPSGGTFSNQSNLSKEGFDIKNLEDDDLRMALGNLMCNGLADHVDFPIIKKIIRGEFVELDRLLPPTLEEIQRKSKKLGTMAYDKDDGRFLVDKEWDSNQIKGFNQWSQAFDIFSSIYCISHPDERFDLLAYVRIIRKASQSMTGKVGSHHWLMYDRLFRGKKAKYPGLSWATIDWEIFALNVLLPLAAGPGKKESSENVSSSQSNDKQRKGYQSQSASKKSGIVKSFKKPSIPCRNFNTREGCSFNPCNFGHFCKICKSASHPVQKCRYVQKNQTQRHQGSQRDRT